MSEKSPLNGTQVENVKPNKMCDLHYPKPQTDSTTKPPAESLSRCLMGVHFGETSSVHSSVVCSFTLITNVT